MQHSAAALERFAPVTGLVALLATVIAVVDAPALMWLAPVGLPLLLVIPMTVITSRVGLGQALRSRKVLLIPEEYRSPAVMRRAWLHASQLGQA